MATNKIYFNNTTTPVTLKGIYYNGVKVENCKGIKLNGTVVVNFASSELNWTDYTNAYNDVWTSVDPTSERNKIAKITAENEFAICRSAWTLYTRQELAGTDVKLFNFNSDGRLYIGNEIAQNWSTLLGSHTDPITIISPHNQIPLYSMLTGLPLIYKKEDATFAGTTILSGSDDGSYDITYDYISGEWKIGLADLSMIKDHGGAALTAADVVWAISNTLGVTAEATDDSAHITITGAENWGEFEFLDALSNVYVLGFGPFYKDDAKETDELFRLIPNENFLDQPYWSVNINLEIRIKNPWLDTLNPCDFYILTGWGLKYIREKIGEAVGNYFVQGEDNAKVNITYFDTSCFAGLQYPNILCSMNSSYSSFCPDYIFTSGNWAGIDTTDYYGSGTTTPIFPTDCPYAIGDLTLSDLDSILPNEITEWIGANNLQKVKVTCVLNQDFEEDYIDGNDIIPLSIANDVFNLYQQRYPDNFPYNNPSNPTKIVEYALKLKMRTYPSYATGNGGTGAAYENIWYLNSYDPYNVGGYYPVKKTKKSVAGKVHNTVCNYTA